VTGWLLGVLVAALAGVGWLCHLLDRRQRHVHDVMDRSLEEMDQHPEFDLSPADWPYRESPRRECRR
jgi:hypothetical protein